MNYNKEIYIKERKISLDTPTYFIADIASNHDGDLERAKSLIWLAKEAGADAVKFQHFLAEKIVSDYGFKHLGVQIGHQSTWKKSVFDVYKECEYHRDWNQALAETASEAGIDFMTTPYDIEAVEQIDSYVPAYKIGSGDITWVDFIDYVAKKQKPVFLATGASSLEDVERAVNTVVRKNPNVVLMQCNTNYTGSIENFKYVNLNVFNQYKSKYPNMLLGLSDHTPGHVTVLGAVALGARVIEKHFTSDNSRIGPDHAFSMNPKSWREMMDSARALEYALGDGEKKVEDNEKDTVVVQQRCLRLVHDVQAGHKLQAEDLEALRPAPVNAYKPYQKLDVIGKYVINNMAKGQEIYAEDLSKEVLKC